MRFRTKLIRAGIQPDSATGALITPIYQTTTFVFDDIGVHKGFDYSRTGNPTRKALEDNLAELEGGTYGIALPTGMAAETTVLSLFKKGEHILCGNDVYGGTVRLLNYFSGHFGLEVDYISMQNPRNVADAVKPNTRAIWAETPSNPLLNIVDLEAIHTIASENSVLLIVDNTFLSPFFQQPIGFGADIVVHSTTKYLSGHNDGLGGAIVCTESTLAEQLYFSANALGNAQGAFDSWLILRGIKTLAVRMKEHEKSAMKTGRFLSEHKAVKRVYYPGLEDHPQSELIRKQMTGFGGMLSFEVEGGVERVNRIMRNVDLFYIAESFGGVESLIEHPQTMSHASMSPSEQAEAGITGELIRLSVGLEDPDDLLEDLDKALSA
ncbi:trans-sulfuration enzyme family protein [candidate division KSB1 bacterium]